jgi:hypothetical protein
MLPNPVAVDYSRGPYFVGSKAPQLHAVYPLLSEIPQHPAASVPSRWSPNISLPLSATVAAYGPSFIFQPSLRLFHQYVARPAVDSMRLQQRAVVSAAVTVVGAARLRDSSVEALRLSIHPRPSVGKEKLPMSLVPHKSSDFSHTP